MPRKRSYNEECQDAMQKKLGDAGWLSMEATHSLYHGTVNSHLDTTPRADGKGLYSTCCIEIVYHRALSSSGTCH